MSEFERNYVGLDIELLSEDRIFTIIDEITYDMNVYVIDRIQGTLFIDRLYDELNLRAFPYDETVEDDIYIFLSEMKRKSKIMTGRNSKYKEFKNNKNLRKSWFVFNDPSMEYGDDGYYNWNEDDHTMENGRYKRYYESRRKSLKKQSNKRLRQHIYDLPKKGSKYKLVLDIAWIID